MNLIASRADISALIWSLPSVIKVKCQSFDDPTMVVIRNSPTKALPLHETVIGWVRACLDVLNLNAKF
jgi:hypothetical protein